MATWSDVHAELDLWARSGRTVTAWWRDDDAVDASPALDRLLVMSEAHAIPVALAVIPRDVGEPFRAWLAGRPHAWVLQHGWSHQNHAPATERQQEFGPHRPMADRLGELASGWRRIAGFRKVLPVLVAPWNRLDPELVPLLPSAGLRAVSTLGPRPAARPAAGVCCNNVHVDIIAWDRGGGFVGVSAALDQLVEHLYQRRTGAADPDEATGVMTHHAYHDDGCWSFMDELFRQTRGHGAIEWIDPQRAFFP
jgi:hypothetical protein